MPLTPTLSPLVPRGEREKISGGCVKMRPGASGYNHHGPEPGRQERRSPDQQELAPRAHRAELEFGAPLVVSRSARADRHTSLDTDARQPAVNSTAAFRKIKE